MVTNMFDFDDEKIEKSFLSEVHTEIVTSCVSHIVKSNGRNSYVAAGQ